MLALSFWQSVHKLFYIGCENEKLKYHFEMVKEYTIKTNNYDEAISSFKQMPKKTASVKWNSLKKVEELNVQSL
ncbi:MAG: hypothetical protein D6732_03880 [Methanobacteriota archaeon]|nr:MAG: hypothetical protein D6732_03880 [Euryarchaeota archaeon]